MSGNVPVSFAYLERDGRVLLVQEGGRQPYGLWCFPGGHVDPGETPDIACVRETKEETGYEVEIVKPLLIRTVSGLEYKGPFSENDKQIDIHLFEVRIVGGDLIGLNNELLDVAWFAKDHAIKLPHRWEWLKEIIG